MRTGEGVYVSEGLCECLVCWLGKVVVCLL